MDDTQAVGDWRWLIEVGVMIGFSVPQVYALTIPELILASRGYRMRMGEKLYSEPAMSRSRLADLMAEHPDTLSDELIS